MGSLISLLSGGGAAKKAAKKAGAAVAGAGKKVGKVFRRPRMAKYTEERVMSYTEPPPDPLMQWSGLSRRMASQAGWSQSAQDAVRAKMATRSQAPPPPPPPASKAKAKAKPATARMAKYTEERVMSYTEPPPGTLMADKYMEAFVPGTYMTDKYTGSGGTTTRPGDYVGLPAATTKTGKPAKPPTAGTSKYLNNHPALPGGDVNNAMPLSPMVEKVVHPINFSLILLTILFIVFVSMRK